MANSAEGGQKARLGIFAMFGHLRVPMWVRSHAVVRRRMSARRFGIRLYDIYDFYDIVNALC